MADKQMTGIWHASEYGFTAPTLADSGLNWLSPEISTSFKAAFRFQQGYYLDKRGEVEPLQFAVRTRGVVGFGGVWDYLLFDPTQPKLVNQQRLLALGLAPDELPDQSAALHVRVQSGHLSERALHWVELFNPLTRRREHLSEGEFGDLCAHLQNIAAHAQLERERETGQRANPRAEETLLSGALLLANLFAPKHLPFELIVGLTARLQFSGAHRCLAELPEDANELGIRHLVTLYS